jgi:putative oxygen-independent coproporphyrinogen III oxidase
MNDSPILSPLHGPSASSAPLASFSDDAFGVYVHWPFCAAKCPYCDFNSHVRHTKIDEPRYVAAFIREIAFMKTLKPTGKLVSIFFGGGTPSLMHPKTIEGILAAIDAAWGIDTATEITLEANPSSVEAERFLGYRTAGVNRVSLGVQSLRAADLKALGRMHTVEEAQAAISIAARTFERFSFDLIYARPDQTVAAWREELEEGLSYARDHLSLYQLTIEPDTPFEKLHKAGKLVVPNADVGRDFFDTTQEICEKAGLPAYEVSNHARLGAECQHNLIYWRSHDYIGIGAGAHGRISITNNAHTARIATVTHKMPETWLTQTEAQGNGISETETLSAEAMGDEFLLMGLRLREGIDLARFAHISGRTLDPHAEHIQDLVRYGMIEFLPQQRLRVTAEGFAVLDAVVADLAG